MRQVQFPDMVSIREIFTDWEMQRTDISNGKYREDSAALRGQRAFIHQRKVDATETAIRFGHYGAKVGIKVRKDESFFCYTISAGVSAGTYGHTTKRIRDYLAWGLSEAEQHRKIACRWSFDAIAHPNGKTLIIAQDATYIGVEYLAYLDSDRFNAECKEMYSEENRAQFAIDDAQRKLAESFVIDSQYVRIDAAKEAGIQIKRDPY